MVDDSSAPASKKPKPKRPRGIGRNRGTPGAMIAYAKVEKERADRRAQVFAMRVQGMAYRDIAEKLNMSTSACHGDFELGRQQYCVETLEQERAVFNARMDVNYARLNADLARMHEILSVHRPLAEAGSQRSARLVNETISGRLAILAEQRQIAVARMKMNGGEAAAKVDITGLGAVLVQVSPEMAKAYDPPIIVSETVTDALPGPSDSKH